MAAGSDSGRSGGRGAGAGGSGRDIGSQRGSGTGGWDARRGSRPDRPRSEHDEDRKPRRAHAGDGQDRGRERRDARVRDRAAPPPAKRAPRGKLVEPELPEELTPDDLDLEVRRDLRGLPRDLAETVARHLVAVGELLEDDPGLALAHARYARSLATRVAVVREAAGLAAYRAGEWAEALAELRAARRIGGPGHLPVIADLERALGRPERALELVRDPEARNLPAAEAVELLIVVAGARRDLGQHEAAVVSLQVPELDPERREPWTARLLYAYADCLLAAGRLGDAVRWFLAAANADEEGDTDAPDRAAQVAARLAAPGAGAT